MPKIIPLVLEYQERTRLDHISVHRRAAYVQFDRNAKRRPAVIQFTKNASTQRAFLLNIRYIYTVRVKVYASVEGRPGLS